MAAGHSTGDVFAPDAVEKTFEAAHGVPRAVNRIAKLALEHAWLKGSPNVSAESVSAVVRDLERYQLSA